MVQEREWPLLAGPIGVLTLSREGWEVAARLDAALTGLDLYAHQNIMDLPRNVKQFAEIAEVSAEVFGTYRGLIYIMPCGVVVRTLASLIRHKLQDPAVVVLDVGARWAISLLSGHEGGANRLAEQVAWIVGAEPVITTTTEAAKSVIAGIGCRRGVSAEEILAALDAALADSGLTRQDVRLLASADIKRNEEGLREAAVHLGAGLRFVASTAIRESRREFTHSEWVQVKVDLPAVAEPAALLAGSRTRLIASKKKYGNVTIALARERLEVKD